MLTKKILTLTTVVLVIFAILAYCLIVFWASKLKEMEHKPIAVFRISDVYVEPHRRYPTIELNLKTINKRTKNGDFFRVYNTYNNNDIFRVPCDESTQKSLRFSFGPILQQNEEFCDCGIEWNDWLNYEIGKDYYIYDKEKIHLCNRETNSTVSAIFLAVPDDRGGDKNGNE